MIIQENYGSVNGGGQELTNLIDLLTFEVDGDKVDIIPTYIGGSVAPSITTKYQAKQVFMIYSTNSYIYTNINPNTGETSTTPWVSLDYGETWTDYSIEYGMSWTITNTTISLSSSISRNAMPVVFIYTYEEE